MFKTPLLAFLSFKHHKGCAWSFQLFIIGLYELEDFVFNFNALLLVCIRQACTSILKHSYKLTHIVRKEHLGNFDCLLLVFELLRELRHLCFQLVNEIFFEIFKRVGSALQSKPLSPDAVR